MIRLDNKWYDILHSVSRWLYAFGLFYIALGEIWGVPYADQVNKTIVAVGSLIAAILEKSTVNYLKDKEGR